MAVVKCIKVSWHSITVLRNTFLLILAGKTGAPILPPHMKLRLRGYDIM